ncbi:STE/STE11/SSK protein kinase [Helicocarpus griseus UAMH5409]|uniref:MAP kinase kinase kinase n=1 Tax=Helicocarpus griseus UAMH5409 TaxID=1447875 RepID=A0A2B7WY99_9EURO|nr:STE/STE11/SSK protein kinase [Helicocarpus griseus UAMH5409]
MDHPDPSSGPDPDAARSDYFHLHPPYLIPDDHHQQHQHHQQQAQQYTNGLPQVDEIPAPETPRIPNPSHSPSAPGAQSPYPTWSPTATRPRGSSGGGASLTGYDPSLPPPPTMSSTNDRDLRPQRPSGPARTPSNTYAPVRKPPQFTQLHSATQVPAAPKRPTRRDPDARYRAQEKAYVQRVRQGPNEWFNTESQIPGPGYDQDYEPEEESPSSESQFESDVYDTDAHLVLDDEDAQPTLEEMQDPKNKERLEWYSMLASVLKGDVIRQEKQRLIGTMEQKSREVWNLEIFLGAKAARYGRPISLQKKVFEYQISKLGSVIEDIISFEIKGETEAGKPPMKQVEDAMEKIEKCEGLYPSRRILQAEHPRTASDEFQESCDAIIAWHNTTWSINTELAILQRWVGNDELDFSRPLKMSSNAADLSDDGSFLDRMMKEDGLKTLQSTENVSVDSKKKEPSILDGVDGALKKAKASLIENAEAFAKRHLPPYIEELLTLLNFPSRLIQEIIRLRLSYARKMKDPGLQSPILVDQMIAQFQILLKVAVDIKQRYLILSDPEPGWDLPPCIDENFDNIVVDGLKYYFKLLNWKLSANKNTFKEAEILEGEWEFSNDIGRQLENGDIEVAEQFSTLTAKSLQRLMIHFERELNSRPDEDAVETEKRYKQIFDSVRVRQRKLFRFSRLLRQRFENATEFNLRDDMVDTLSEALLASGHFLVTSHDSVGQKGVHLVASPALYGRPKDIQSILGTSFRAEHLPNDPSNPYVLVVRPEKGTFVWNGKRMEVDLLEHPTDVRLGKLRLVADGSQQRLQDARTVLTRLTGLHLDIVVEQRANLGRVNVELNKIKKTAYKLSTGIIDSVEVVRRQIRNAENHELIQSCFAFATEFGKRSLMYMDASRRSMNHTKLVKLGLDWVSFICDDCDAADRKTFKWAVSALEFAMIVTHGQSVLAISEEDYCRLREKVAGCMSLLISHFDIMGARSSLAAQAEKQHSDPSGQGFRKLDVSRIMDDTEAAQLVQEQREALYAGIDLARIETDAKRQVLGKVLEGVNEADKSVSVLSSSATNVTLRWQQGQFIGGGTSGSVYAAIDLDTSYLMAVKEIRLQEPSVIPGAAQQIRDEMGVLEVLDHPNIISYYGIEVHRDKVYIFMEYCSGGSLATLLEHGRIEDETVIMVYTLQMLEGLAYLHQAGIVHRDIKPANILLDHNGVIKYVDFGAAMIIARQGKTLAAMDHYSANGRDGRGQAKDGQRKNQKSVTGTPMYMSPELVRGEIGHTSGRHGCMDIWSLGCVILEMATGHRPWSGVDNEWAIMYKIAQGSQPQLPTPDQLSPMGIDFIKRCFETDPVKRPSATELLQHEWIVSIRQQVVAEPQTPGSDGSGSSQPSSAGSSRQNSSNAI